MRPASVLFALPLGEKHLNSAKCHVEHCLDVCWIIKNQALDYLNISAANQIFEEKLNAFLPQGSLTHLHARLVHEHNSLCRLCFACIENSLMKCIPEASSLPRLHEILFNKLYCALQNIDLVCLILEASELVLHDKDALYNCILRRN